MRHLINLIRTRMTREKIYDPEELFQHFYGMRKWTYQDIRAAIQYAKGHYP
ncbi:MAG: hypothetical protein LW852_10555 [Sediminibacterium sp.]|nr:hypothetical protein [Sediminibacterium sp.]